jgi:hypothetical protein
MNTNVYSNIARLLLSQDSLRNLIDKITELFGVNKIDTIDVSIR